MITALQPARRPITERQAPRPGAEGVPGARNLALDFTKGALVLCMIVYHALNYFRYDPNLLRHLQFLPSSFIFIVGFLITHVYLPKAQGNEAQVSRRLLIRGLKTLALFAVLNLAVHALFTSSYNRPLGLGVLWANIDQIFLGSARRAAVFSVLLPISYLLLLAAVMLRFARGATRILPILAAAVFAGSAVLSFRGNLVSNLDLMSMGLLGMVAGLVPRQRLDALATAVALPALAYLGYSLVIRFWYPGYLLNTFGVGLSLLLFYAIGRRCTPPGRLAGWILLLGQYSLLGYLVQIAILQVLFRIGRAWGMDDELLLPLLATAGLTLATAWIVGWLRARSTTADRLYQAVFA